MRSMTDALLVLTTAGSKDEAQKIARALVEHHLAACVNIVPGIESVYRWQGAVENAQEWLLIIKTTAFDPVRDAIKQLHSYELPECIAIPLARGSSEYLAWLGDSVAPVKKNHVPQRTPRK